MKALSLIFAGLLIYQSTFATVKMGGSGSDAGNGGGLAEKNLIFGQSELAKFIELCLSTNLCHTDAKENELLTQIAKTMSDELKVPLQFKSERTDKNSFHIDGVVRVARTGDRVGSPVLINTDLLYSKTKEGIPVAVDVPQALSILIHEYGHHHKVKDHARLDRLGTKLQTLVLNHEVRAEFWNGNAALSIYQFNSVRNDSEKKNITQLDRIVLENQDELVDLTEGVAKAFQCPGRSQAKGIRLYNAYGERGTHFDKSTQTLTKPMKAWFIASCSEGTEFDHGDVSLVLNFKKISDDHFSFLPEQTQIRFSGCKNDPGVCK